MGNRDVSTGLPGGVSFCDSVRSIVPLLGRVTCTSLCHPPPPQETLCRATKTYLIRGRARIFFWTSKRGVNIKS